MASAATNLRTGYGLVTCEGGATGGAVAGAPAVAVHVAGWDRQAATGRKPVPLSMQAIACWAVAGAPAVAWNTA